MKRGGSPTKGQSPRPDPPTHYQMPHPDRLEEFVRAHREEFDAEPPPAHVWDEVERRLDRRGPQRRAPGHVARVVALYPYWRKAAVACMLLTIGVLSGLLLSDRLGAGALAEGPRRTPVRELEASYRQLLTERVAEIEALGPDSALRVALVGLSQPDSQLASELDAFAEADEHLVLEAMAQEYQAKLDALERVLTRVRASEARQRRPARRTPRVNEAPAVERL